MEMILSAIVYTLGQGLAFNVVLPIWYLFIQIFGA